MNSVIKFNGTGRDSIFPEFPSLLDDLVTRDFFNLPAWRASKMNTVPAVNIRETNTAFELEMAIPGMDKKDFKIELERDLLKISAQQENKTEEKSEDGRYTRREFSYQSFSREFQLPENSVNDGDISANYKNGVLHILIPKKEPAKPKAPRKIAIA